MLTKIKTWINNPDKNYQEGVEIFKQHKINNKYDAYFMQVTDPPKDDMHFKLLTKKVAQVYRKLVLNPPEKPETPVKEISVKKIDLKKPGKAKLRTVKELIDNFDNLKFELLPYGELKKLSNELSPDLGKQPKSKDIISHLKGIRKVKTEKPDVFELIDRPKIRKPENEINFEDLPEHLQVKFKENQQLTGEMATMHAKAKASQDIEARKSAMECLLELDDRRAENWIEIDTWYKTKDDKPAEPDDVITRVINFTKKINSLNVNISRTEKKLEASPNNKKAPKWKLRLNQWKSGKAETERQIDALKNLKNA